MDKYIDKLIDNRWFIRVVALALALLLFESVYDGNRENEVNVPQDQDVETITDVPVKSYFDTENLVVSGVPETVDLKISGPKSYIQQAKTQKNFEVFVNLTDAEIGTQRVPILIKDISEKIKVTIEPAYANVSVQEKETKELKVEAEYNQDIVAKGYVAGIPIVEPNKVKITGAKDIVDKITYVKATLNVKGPLKEDVSREANILVLDKDLNKLDVIVEPETVEVKVPIKSSSKTVPIRIVQKGSPPEGIKIDSISFVDEDEAKIIADEEILKKTDSVRVEVDVSSIDKDTTLTLPVIISDGIVEVSPQTVKVFVKVDKNTDKTISNIPIKTRGLSEQYNIDFTDPENGTVDLAISGSSDLLDGLGQNDFELFIDVTNLEAGEHDVEININGPTGVNWNLNKSTAKISITQKEV